MAYPQDRRAQVFTGPGFDNRPFRKGVVKGFSQRQNLDPRRSGADAAAMLEDEAGLKFDNQGNLGSTRNYQRDLILGSQQRNSLSPGVKAGYGSTLRTPLNSNLTPRNFSEGIRQRNQTLVPGAPAMSREQRVAQAQSEGTFDTIRDRYNTDNAGAGLSMNEFGNINKVNPLTQTQAAPLPSYLKRPAPSLDPDTPKGASAAARSKMMQPRSVMGALTKGLDYNPLSRKTASEAQPSSAQETTSASTNAPANQQEVNRAGLEDRAAGLRLLREMSQTPLQVTATDGGKTLVGKYGTGSASNTSGAKNQGMIDGQPASDVLRELANKQVREGTWRKGDRLPDAGTQNTKAYDRKSRSGLLTEEQALSESEKARQSRQSLQRLTKR